ncbi:MAG: L,D-transpeptidase [Mojavia pulchra JT2-VF2]|jgi:lipoprotein-anchoring transpeptidase ErfK/SrfK|uniref:L,D-transpeptidase n=1 Tax=Mojavia pulchra JT2-VF2 TaxID=287848 RepID=A0A951Q085_9NOST|nr:L,D-transpeptidase [Mojavia pulchra JT2-VF2]
MLVLATFFSWSLPITVDPNFVTARAASVDSSKNTVSKSKSKQITQSRRIEIDLSEQRLSAWEGKKRVYSFRISTGKRSTPTPTGKFQINSKYRINRMRGRTYDIPDVPYAMYFYEGYAIHGAYWHNKFGTPVSHGCVNLPVKKARQLYNWAKVGTVVVVRK